MRHNFTPQQPLSDTIDSKAKAVIRNKLRKLLGKKNVDVELEQYLELPERYRANV